MSNADITRLEALLLIAVRALRNESNKKVAGAHTKNVRKKLLQLGIWPLSSGQVGQGLLRLERKELLIENTSKSYNRCFEITAFGEASVDTYFRLMKEFEVIYMQTIERER